MEFKLNIIYITALAFAAIKGNTEVFKLLLAQKNIDINIKNI